MSEHRRRAATPPAAVLRTTVRLAAIIFLLLVTCGAASAPSSQSGMPAPRIELSDVAGKALVFGAGCDGVMVVVFWAPWCTGCRDELSAMERLYRTFRHEGLQVIGVCVECSPASVRAVLQKTGVSFSVVLDTDGGAADAYRVTGLPTSFLIDRSGTIRSRTQGSSRMTHVLLEQTLRTLMTHTPDHEKEIEP